MAKSTVKGGSNKANAASRNSTSIVEKLSMLRSFVANDAFNETDLSTCLRQSAYNVEVAAERLMTGQFQPSKRHKVGPENSSSNSSTPLASKSTSSLSRITPRPAAQGTATTTASQVPTKIRKPTPVTPKTPSSSSAISTTFQSPSVTGSGKSPASAASSLKVDSESSNNMQGDESLSLPQAWLLCHRWISDGICIQRNGCVAYQETLQVEYTSSASTSPKSSATSTAASNNKKAGSINVRFRGSRIQGQFPKHLSPMLGPLLEAKLIHVKAQALMEERFLPTGVDVAFAVWIYVLDPLKFLGLLDQTADTAQASNSSKAFFPNAHKTKQAHRDNGQSVYQKAAFGLLQWAQHGETFDFETPVSPSSPKSEKDEDVLMDDNEDYNPEDAERNAKEVSDNLIKDAAAAQLQEMEPPTDGSFKVTLRPYQRQALWWMTQREGQQEMEDSSRQQLELLEELVSQSNSSSLLPMKSPILTKNSTAPSIHCECGPVLVDTATIQAPAVVDALQPPSSSSQASNPNLKHPLWERRFLCNASATQAVSFYVQPIFGAAMASPPPPPKPCRGGILADSMGLGKTVMLLALIRSSMDDETTAPKDKKDVKTTVDSDAKISTTLIVSPLSLLAQWQEEIESKTSLTYHVYYGDKKQGAIDFDNFDIVLTTYGSLQGEWVAHSKTDPEHPVMGGLLGHAWKRVILDEAHCIKNTATVASRACCLLQSERRWCVSGTIIQNSLDDVYALLKFLRHEPWCQPSFWKAAISSKLRSTGDDHLQQKQEALDRVRRLLAPIMLRRTKESVDKNGEPILTLPPVETKIIPVEFTPAERHFYDALHRKSLSLFEGFIRAGTASKSWLAIFSLLHRLRQTCDHVALTIRVHMDDDEWASNIAQLKEGGVYTTESAAVTGAKDAINKKFLDDLMGKFRAMQSPVGVRRKGCSQDDSEDAPYAAKIAQMLNEAVQNKSNLLKEECSICLDPICLHDSVVTNCFHIFCKDCLVGVLRQQGSNQNADSNKPAPIIRLPNGPCPVCNEQVEASKILRLSQSEGHIQTSYLLDSIIAPTAAAEREGDGVARQALETAIQGSSSSKLTAIMNELDNVWNEDPGSKVLIFSQFLGFLDLIEESFKASKIPFARLDGKLNLKERMAILQEFGRDQGESRRISSTGSKKNVGSVLLISMKAGGVGLNLVSARTVFIADRWWNASVEDQCVDRIHRIGQTAAKVRVRKFYVANSVEERIVELQKRKKNVASQVLCDKKNENSEDQSASRPTLEDFKILFQE